MTTRTCIKSALRQLVWESFDQRLLIGFTAAQAIKINPMIGQIDVTAQQAMAPEWINLPTMPQYFDAAVLIGS
jgi:hypothetical protein